jgi:LacI family transcriptional regulator
MHPPERSEQIGSGLCRAVPAIIEQTDQRREADGVAGEDTLVRGVVGGLSGAVEKIDAELELLLRQLHLAGEVAEVVERVQAEARRQGYRRDALAASLRTGRSRLVGVLVPDLANPVFAPILNGISARLSREGYSMLIAGVGASEADQAKIVEELIARRVDGLLLATARRKDAVLTACLGACVPTVLVNRREDAMRASSVVSDDIRGQTLAVEHLVGLGHRAIGHLAGPGDVSTGLLRLEGFQAAMRAAGLDPSRVAQASAYSRDAGETAAAALLDRWPEVTAIAASNDLLALGAILELRRRGLGCPEQMSIVGYNDMPMLDMVDPPLTTINIGHEDMGDQAASALIAEIAAGERHTAIFASPGVASFRSQRGRSGDAVAAPAVEP